MHKSFKICNVILLMISELCVMILKIKVKGKDKEMSHLLREMLIETFQGFAHHQARNNFSPKYLKTNKQTKIKLKMT